VVEGAAGAVNEREDEERETVEMCTDVAHARLGCQLVVSGDVTIRAVE
jgi:ferredoxin